MLLNKFVIEKKEEKKDFMTYTDVVETLRLDPSKKRYIACRINNSGIISILKDENTKILINDGMSFEVFEGDNNLIQ